MPTALGSTGLRLEKSILKRLHTLRDGEPEKVALDEFIGQLIDVYFDVKTELGIPNISIKEAQLAVIHVFREYQKDHPEMKSSFMENVRLGVKVGKAVGKKFKESKASEKEAKPED